MKFSLRTALLLLCIPYVALALWKSYQTGYQAGLEHGYDEIWENGALNLRRWQAVAIPAKGVHGKPVMLRVDTNPTTDGKYRVDVQDVSLHGWRRSYLEYYRRENENQ